VYEHQNSTWLFYFVSYKLKICSLCFNSLTHFFFCTQFNCSSSPNNVPPTWLQNLLTEKFYNACLIHQESKKNEKNVYCVDCCISLCSHCVPPHRSHRLLQVQNNLIFSNLIFLHLNFILIN
jgi:fatty-acid desaturase